MKLGDDTGMRFGYSVDVLERARSFLGYPPVLKAKPNFTHLALANLSINGLVKHHITQNVFTFFNSSIDLIVGGRTVARGFQYPGQVH